VFNIVPLSGVVGELDAAIVELGGRRDPSLPLGWGLAGSGAGSGVGSGVGKVSAR
jgi:hypothetical protein